MKQITLLLLFLLPSFHSFGQLDSRFVEKDDLLKMLELDGIRIFKSPISSDSTFSFNLIFRGYLNGQLVDSGSFASEKMIHQLSEGTGRRLEISPDTNFLRIIAKELPNRGLELKIDYSILHLAGHNVAPPVDSLQRFYFRGFDVPVISERKDYPVFLIYLPWKQKFEGTLVNRHCFSGNLSEMKKLLAQFYLISILAY